MTTATTSRLSTALVNPVLPAENIVRAKHFYQEVLGLEIDETGTGPGSFFALGGGGSRILVYERSRTKAEHTAAGFSVSDLRATVSELRARGVVFEEYDMPGLKTTQGIAEMASGLSAWFKDSEGNIIAIAQM